MAKCNSKSTINKEDNKKIIIKDKNLTDMQNN